MKIGSRTDGTVSTASARLRVPRSSRPCGSGRQLPRSRARAACGSLVALSSEPHFSSHNHTCMRTRVRGPLDHHSLSLSILS